MHIHMLETDSAPIYRPLASSAVNQILTVNCWWVEDQTATERTSNPPLYDEATKTEVATTPFIPMAISKVAGACKELSFVYYINSHNCLYAICLVGNLYLIDVLNIHELN